MLWLINAMPISVSTVSRHVPSTSTTMFSHSAELEMRNFLAWANVMEVIRISSSGNVPHPALHISRLVQLSTKSCVSMTVCLMYTIFNSVPSFRGALTKAQTI